MDYPAYDPALDTPVLDDAELQSLDDLLAALPGDAVMNVEALDGYLTALLVGPPVLGRLRTSDWLPVVWGGDAAAISASHPFASQKQKKRASFLVLRHLHAIQQQLQGPAADWQPVFSIAEHDGREWVDAEDWCAGFLHATPLDSSAWGDLFDNPALASALVPIALLGSDEAGLSAADQARLADAEQRDALSRAVVDAVVALRAHAMGNLAA